MGRARVLVQSDFVSQEPLTSDPLPETLPAWRKRALRLAVPIIVSNISVPLLGIVDTAVVGHLDDPAYIGAVGLGATIITFLLWSFGFLRQGTTGFAAQAFGAGDGAGLRATLGRGLLLAGVLGVLIWLLQVPVRYAALAILDGSELVEGLAGVYFDIRVWGAPAVLATYVGLGVLVGTQRTGKVLAIQLVMNLINIILDLVFVLGFGWGVAGVAAASLIAEVYGGVASLVLVFGALKAVPGRLAPGWLSDWPALRRMMAVNRDIFLRTLCLKVAFLGFARFSSQLGDVTLAANMVLMQFETLAAYGLDGFAHAAEALTGGAYGAGKRGAWRNAVRATTEAAAVTALVFAGLFTVGGPALIGLMTDIAAVRAEAVLYLPWAIAVPVVAVWCYQLDGIFLGATRAREMRDGMVLSLLAFLLSVALFLDLWGNHGLWLSMLIFLATRGVTLGWWLPRIDRALAGAASVEQKAAEFRQM